MRRLGDEGKGAADATLSRSRGLILLDEGHHPDMLCEHATVDTLWKEWDILCTRVANTLHEHVWNT